MSESLTKRVLLAIGEEPVTSAEIAIKLGINPRDVRSRISLLLKRGDIVFVDLVDAVYKKNAVKRYVRAGCDAAVNIETRLCHASNDWLRTA